LQIGQIISGRITLSLNKRLRTLLGLWRKYRSMEDPHDRWVLATDRSRTVE